jgi:hypothetical protein
MSTSPLIVPLSDEFRLLVAEIMEAEGLAWPEAFQRARAVSAELGPVDPEAPVCASPNRWPFIAWLLGLALAVSLSLNATFVWLLFFGG